MDMRPPIGASMPVTASPPPTKVRKPVAALTPAEMLLLVITRSSWLKYFFRSFSSLLFSLSGILSSSAFARFISRLELTDRPYSIPDDTMLRVPASIDTQPEQNCIPPDTVLKLSPTDFTVVSPITEVWDEYIEAPLKYCTSLLVSEVTPAAFLRTLPVTETALDI